MNCITCDYRGESPISGMCEGCVNCEKHSKSKKKPLKYWNRRVIKHGEGKKAYYQIHRVYYINDKIEMWSENGIRPGGETLDELIEELKDMLNIANYAKLKSGRLPVLIAGELPKAKGEKNEHRSRFFKSED